MKYSTGTFIAMTGIAFSLYSGGCAGPDMYFDTAPPPRWLHQDSCRLNRSTGLITAVGRTPVTQLVDEDLRLAKYDAVSKVAQMISSEVSSTTSVWQAEYSTGKKTQDRAILAKDIRIRSRIRVADVRVRRQYRDKRTKTAYVQVAVDARAWIRRIEHRLSGHIRTIAEQVKIARGFIQADRPLHAYAHLMIAARAGKGSASDLVVLNVLNRKNKTGQRLYTLEQKADSMIRKLKNKMTFSVMARATFPDAARLCAGRIRDFLRKKGFRVKRNGNIKVRALLSAKNQGTVRIATRIEHVFSAIAGINVKEPDGSTVGPLSFSAPDGRYSAKANRKNAAYKKAVFMGADLLQAGFRSRFRHAFFQADASDTWR